MTATFRPSRRAAIVVYGILAIAALCGYVTLRGAALVPAATSPPHAVRMPPCDAAEVAAAREHLRAVDATQGPESAAAGDAIDAIVSCVLRAPATATDPDLELARRALAISEKLDGGDSLEAAGRLSRLAGICSARQKYDDAILHAQRAYDIRMRLEGPESRKTAETLYDLAESHRMAGHFAQAIRFHTEGIALRVKMGETESLSVADALHYLGVLWWDLGDPEKALPLMERAVVLRQMALGPDDPMVAVSLNMLANQLSRTGERERAMQLYVRAQTIWEKSRGPEHPDVARSLTNQGLLLAESGRTDEAEPLLERALEIREKALGKDSFLAARSLTNLADLRAAQKDLASAEALYDRAVAIEVQRRTKYTRESASTYAGRAAVRWARGELDAAVADSLTAEKTARAFFVNSSSGLSESASLRYEAARTPGLDVALSVAALRAEDDGPRAVAARSIWNEVVLSQALVLELMAGGGGADLDPAQVAGGLPGRSALILYIRYERHMASKWAGTIPSYLAMVLEPRSDGEYPGKPYVVSLGPAAAIDALIQEWRREVSHDPRLDPRWHDARSYRAAGARLREAIWDPLGPALEGAGTVFVVPDGAINLVSLATLPSSAGRFLIETDPKIHYLSAARDLVAAPRSPPGSGVLVMGGADYERSARTGPVDHRKGESPEAWSCHSETAFARFAPLPESLLEAQEVAGRLRTREEVTLVTGDAADECSFKKLAPGRRILHLATHGFFIPGCGTAPPHAGPGSEPPKLRESTLALSGLVMAGANHRPADGSGDDADEGILMAGEIASVDLSSVEWVVLSGCQTGVGQVMDGEGVLGLRRAFRVAGARTLIMSLWPVEDGAARIWMRRLYDNRLAGKGTTESVTGASFDLLEEQRTAGRTTHPYFWGAFVSVGDWK